MVMMNSLVITMALAVGNDLDVGNKHNGRSLSPFTFPKRFSPSKKVVCPSLHAGISSSSWPVAKQRRGATFEQAYNQLRTNPSNILLTGTPNPGCVDIFW